MKLLAIALLALVLTACPMHMVFVDGHWVDVADYEEDGSLLLEICYVGWDEDCPTEVSGPQQGP